MKIIIQIVAILLAWTGLVASEITLAPFYGSTTFSNSDKDKSTNYGLYYKLGGLKSVVEYQDVKYLPESNTTNFTQTNMALTYDFTSNLYAGIHYINSSNKQYDKSYSALLGLKKKIESLTIGLNYSYSDYDKNNIIKTVQQFTPYIGFSYGDYKSMMGTYYIKISTDLIYTDTNATDIPSEYSTYGISITQNKGSFQNSLQYFNGEHMFAVRDNGLTMQNFEEIYKNSLSISSKYIFSKATSLQLSYIQKDFRTYGDQTKSDLESILLFIYFKF